ncbi:hypothetical protein BTA51_02125 [Hahella sp. CCB-MM4]|uniref:DMT family transporter n=1 Tax=Hahella sp. (strain CCB-MM4) TaxID=1926491 RepID=UPI000B9A8DA7|nr:DMT family transporter [Hahella sp. CCB-MM4]OZG75204.1 hypothetical protein BTA51_02125 [Hahella sp. CCB-MM4]
MLGYIALALLNGAFIGASRVINGRLGLSTGAMGASLWNHVIGFLFLGVILTVIGAWQFDVDILFPQSYFGSVWNAPYYAYFGGFMGALFVAMNSFVLPRIGAIQTTVLVVSGQMLAGIFLNANMESLSLISGKMVGVLLIVTGIYIGRK